MKCKRIIFPSRTQMCQWKEWESFQSNFEWKEATHLHYFISHIRITSTVSLTVVYD